MIELEGSPPETRAAPAPRRGGPGPTLAVLTVGAVTGLALLGLASRPAPQEPSTTVLAPFPDQIETSRLGPEGRWRPAGTIETVPSPAWRLEEGYLVTTADRVALLGPDLRLHPVELEGWRVVRGAIDTPDGPLVFGSADTEPPSSVPTLEGLRPALWRATVDGWERRLLPWRGVVRAVTHTGEGLVAIGDASYGARPDIVLATSSDGTRWEVTKAPWIPDSGVLPVPGGFVARGPVTEDGPYAYLFSPEGIDWEPYADHLVTSAGHVIRIDPRHDVVVIGGQRLPSPDWPVAGAWVEGDRLWLHTPARAWTMLEGGRWEPIPLTDEAGLPGGYPTLLPFGDRLVAAIGFGRHADLYEWHPAPG